jgi:Spy/CpxP family protein refolding chaperone
MTAPRIARQPKAVCIATMLLVFLAGGMVGAVVMSVSHKRLHASSAPLLTSDAKSVYLEKVKKDLDLTAEQTEQMETILDDFVQLYHTVLTDGKARIFQILQPEQRRKFERMIQQAND